MEGVLVWNNETREYHANLYDTCIHVVNIEDRDHGGEAQKAKSLDRLLTLAIKRQSKKYIIIATKKSIL